MINDIEPTIILKHRNLDITSVRALIDWAERYLQLVEHEYESYVIAQDGVLNKLVNNVFDINGNFEATIFNALHFDKETAWRRSAQLSMHNTIGRTQGFRYVVFSRKQIAEAIMKRLEPNRHRYNFDGFVPNKK